MKTSIYILLIVLIGAQLVYAQDDVSDKIEGYDENTEITIRGQIAEVLSPNRGPVVIKVKSENRLYNVLMGPKWFLERNNIILKTGDHIEITGSKFISRDGQIYVITRQCRTKNDPPCRFRNPSLMPMWRGWMHRQ